MGGESRSDTIVSHGILQYGKKRVHYNKDRSQDEMGGPGSGGYKNSPGDTETHSAWDIILQDPESGQVCLRLTTQLSMSSLSHRRGHAICST